MPGPPLCQHIWQQLTMPSEVCCAPGSSSLVHSGYLSTCFGQPACPPAQIFYSWTWYWKRQPTFAHIQESPQMLYIAAQCLSAIRLLRPWCSWWQLDFSSLLLNRSCTEFFLSSWRSQKIMFTTYWPESGFSVRQHEVFKSNRVQKLYLEKYILSILLLHTC